jgi:hypothetical protein
MEFKTLPQNLEGVVSARVMAVTAVAGNTIAPGI